jgi:hypothetical protein
MDMNRPSEGRFRRTVDELIIAELFLVQATIESATALGDGLNKLGKQLLTSDEEHTGSPADSLASTLRRVADEAVEPYSSRFRYLRDTLGR